MVSNRFWKDVILSVIHIKKAEISISDYLQQDIRNLCSWSEYDYYTKWDEKGIHCLNDLINEDGNFKSFDQIQIITNCNNFLKYYHIINHVPKERKNEIKKFKNEKQLFEDCYDDVYLLRINGTKCIKFVYNDLRAKEFCMPDAKIAKWSNEIQDVRSEYIQNYFSLAKSCTNETKLIYFQCKLLNRILTTNTFLHKIGKTENNNCTFCKENPESLIHLFCDCRIIKHFWNECSDWLRNILTFTTTLTNHTIIFGIHSEKSLINHIILICKKYIYNCKYFETIPNFQIAIQKIIQIRNIEKYCQKMDLY